MLSLLAQTRPVINFDPKSAGFQITDIGELFNSLLTLVLLGAALLVFFYLIWGAIDWIVSGGDKGKTEDARKKITASLVGLAILSSAFALMQVVAYFLGINVFNFGNEILNNRPF